VSVKIDEIVHARNGQGFEGGYTACNLLYAHQAGYVRLQGRPVGKRVEEDVNCMACIAAGLER
jgi:hypothetical protein